MTSSSSALGAPVRRSRRSSPAGASVLLLDKDRLPSDQILSTHTIHPPGLDVLDEIGVGDAVRDMAPPTHIVRLRKNDAVVDYSFSGGRAEVLSSQKAA